jgi:hypothetical protein
MNIQSAFKHCGIFPFTSSVISDAAITPSLSFRSSNETNACLDVAKDQHDESDQTEEPVTADA